jgi:hypothetical protein
MKKNIIIIILVVTNLVSLVYAFAQATIANHTEQKALVQSELAKANADSAQVARDKADIYKKLAERNMEELQEAKVALANCE